MTKTHFTVVGKPATKGSWRAITNKKTGKALFIPDNKRSKGWEGAVTTAARKAHGGEPWPKGIAVHLSVVFFFTRPKSHHPTKAGKPDSTRLKPSAPAHPTSRASGDLDKLVRAIGDALSDIVYVDDAQIVSIEAEKVYHRWQGVSVTVEEVK